MPYKRTLLVLATAAILSAPAATAEAVVVNLRLELTTPAGNVIPAGPYGVYEPPLERVVDFVSSSS
jgi:hypothetical protein